MSRLKVVNLFGGPGVGKSTTRSELFAALKRKGVNCEEISEYAKDVTWDENQTLFSDQLFVLANQNRRQFRLQNKVEWAVSDSPLLLSINYVTVEYLPRTFQRLVFELWGLYENHNYLIRRCKPYSPVGRNQTETEAKEIDVNIKAMLDKNFVPYSEVDGDEAAFLNIIADLRKKDIMH